MPALDQLPAVDLSGTEVLTLTGARDPYGVHAPALDAWLRASGADLTAETLPAGHELTGADVTRAKAWLAARG